MAAFTGVALWVLLATVFPGLVTIAVVYGAFAIIAPNLMAAGIGIVAFDSEWMWGAIAVTVMIITQATGILLEEILVRLRWLGSEAKEIELPEGLCSPGKSTITLNPYREFQGMYFLLAQLSETEDSQGHLKRTCAQFFLTNNTLVSFLVGIIATVLIAVFARDGFPAEAAYYASGLAVCLVISYLVAVLRFREMSKCLWGIRNARLLAENKTALTETPGASMK